LGHFTGAYKMTCSKPHSHAPCSCIGLEPCHHGFLCAQTEKQRLIWAYKILFLDVLFPLGLKKVIFLDADQIIRTDVAELWNMDLKVGQGQGQG